MTEATNEYDRITRGIEEGLDHGHGLRGCVEAVIGLTLSALLADVERLRGELGVANKLKDEYFSALTAQRERADAADQRARDEFHRGKVAGFSEVDRYVDLLADLRKFLSEQSAAPDGRPNRAMLLLHELKRLNAERRAI